MWDRLLSSHIEEEVAQRARARPLQINLVHLYLPIITPQERIQSWSQAIWKLFHKLWLTASQLNLNLQQRNKMMWSECVCLETWEVVMMCVKRLIKIFREKLIKRTTLFLEILNFFWKHKLSLYLSLLFGKLKFLGIIFL